jgi:hypothetical protein
MRFGVREICDVVLKAKAAQKIGNKVFYKNEPVIYFDSLKTSSMEGAATTVYAQGGRGNARLVAWEGERTVTFTMEDALISPAGFMILSGAGLIEATAAKPIKVHVTEQTDATHITSTGIWGTSNYAVQSVEVYVKQKPYLPTSADTEDYIYVMALENGEVATEPYIPVEAVAGDLEEGTGDFAGLWKLTLNTNTIDNGDDLSVFGPGAVVLVDYYTEKTSNTQQIEISADKFGGNYYLEASTLFRNTDGVDMPAEFIIPNCKIQSNFTFTMASSGDPSTFTFTMDAFPDYTRFDKTKKVLAAIQIVNELSDSDLVRHRTAHEVAHDAFFID